MLLISQDKISTSKNSIWYKKYEIELTNRIKLETRLKKFEESYNILEKEAEKKFEDLLEERESQQSKNGTEGPRSSNKEAISKQSRLDKVRPKALMLGMSIISSPDLKLERSESATIPMRKKSSDKEQSVKAKPYKLTPSSSLQNIPGRVGSTEPVTNSTYCFSKRKISEEQFSSQSSKSSKQGKKSSKISSQNSCEEARDLVSPLIGNKDSNRFEVSEIVFTTPQPVNHKNMMKHPGHKNSTEDELPGSLEQSGFFSPDSKGCMKLALNQNQNNAESGFMESAEKKSKRRASHFTNIGKRNTASCVLCCNSLHPIFEQLREKEEENQAFR